MTPVPTTPPLWRRAVQLAAVAFALALAAWLGALYADGRCYAAAALREQHASGAAAQSLADARARTASATAAADAAVRRTATAQRLLRQCRDTLRELRAAWPPLDTATGLQAGCPQPLDDTPS